MWLAMLAMHKEPLGRAPHSVLTVALMKGTDSFGTVVADETFR
jgi:hypothetical protein